MVPHRLLIFMAALMMSAVTAYAQDVKPRSIEPGRIIAAGEFPAVALKPRTIALNGFVAQGASASLSSRTIPLTGFVAQGTNTRVTPRTIPLTGWTASPPRGKK